MSHPRSQTPARLVALLEERGPMTARQISEATGLNRSALADHLHAIRGQLDREEQAYLQGCPVVYRVRGDKRGWKPPARADRCACGDCASCDVQAMRREQWQQQRPAHIPPPAPSGTRLVRGLPVLREGPGDRDETCVEYVGCLDRFTRSSAAWAAHCPEACTERRAVDWRIERDEHAGRRDASALTF